MAVAVDLLGLLAQGDLIVHFDAVSFLIDFVDFESQVVYIQT